MYELEITNLGQLADIVRDTHEHWGRFAWYRGCANINYSLLPSLLRFVVPDNEDECDCESYLVHDFLVGYKAYIEHPPANRWELYALMQHHGLPTRLLDWSKSPLTALYFALENCPEHEDAAALWLVDPIQLNSLSPGDPGIYCPGELLSKKILGPDGKNFDLDVYLPAALDPTDSENYPEFPIAIESSLSGRRIRAQQGCFTLHGKDNRPLDEIMTSDLLENPHLKKLIIPWTKRESLLASLRASGINEDFVYQDIDAMCRRIVRTLSDKHTRKT
jgi:hypothetical protein